MNNSFLKRILKNLKNVGGKNNNGDKPLYFSNKFIEAVEKQFIQRMGYLARLDDLFILEKYKNVSIQKEYLDENNQIQNSRCYPIYFKDKLIYFYVPFYWSDLVQKTIVKDNTFWEMRLLKLYDEYIHQYKPDVKNKIMIDCGANIGNHTLYFYHFSLAQKVYCFEPQQLIFDVLKKNILINKVNAELHHRVVSSSQKKFAIHNFSSGNFGVTDFVETQHNADSLIYDSVTLDEICAKDEICAIKIDVEGHEYEVLQGSKFILEKYHPVLWIEIKHHLKEINEILSAYNYKEINQIGENHFFV